MYDGFASTTTRNLIDPHLVSSFRSYLDLTAHHGDTWQRDEDTLSVSLWSLARQSHVPHRDLFSLSDPGCPHLTQPHDGTGFIYVDTELARGFVLLSPKYAPGRAVSGQDVMVGERTLSVHESSEDKLHLFYLR